MRIVEAVNTLFHNQSFICKANFLSGMRGGWERWFQLELAYYIASCYAGTYDITLEDNTAYPGTALRADLTLQSRIMSKTTTTVELKCQVANAPIDNFWALVESDIQKLPALAPGNDYQVIALVRDRKDVEGLYHALATAHPGQVSYYVFSTALSSPGGFVSFYQGAN